MHDIIEQSRQYKHIPLVGLICLVLGVWSLIGQLQLTYNSKLTLAIATKIWWEEGDENDRFYANFRLYTEEGKIIDYSSQFSYSFWRTLETDPMFIVKYRTQSRKVIPFNHYNYLFPCVFIGIGIFGFQGLKMILQYQNKSLNHRSRFKPNL